MTAQALIFTLAIIGIAETAYLIRKKLAKSAPVCIIGQECNKVLESKYNKFLGIPNEVLGLFFYVAVSLLAAFLVIGMGPILWWKRLAEILIFSAAVMSLGLVYIQWRIIKAWCSWCLISAITVFLMAIIILI